MRFFSLMIVLAALSCAKNQPGEDVVAKSIEPRLGRALEQFYFSHGSLPRTIQELIDSKVVDQSELALDRYRFSWRFISNPGSDKFDLRLALVETTVTPLASGGSPTVTQTTRRFGRKYESWCTERTGFLKSEKYVDSYWNLATLLSNSLVDFGENEFQKMPEGYVKVGRVVQKYKNQDGRLAKVADSKLWANMKMRWLKRNGGTLVFEVPGETYEFPLGKGYSALPKRSIVRT